MTVNLVIVSHSAQLAEGTAELARQMGGDEVAIEPAGGLDDGEIGTDAERVRAAIERVSSPDGVLVLMDLGSALMSAEIALEMLEEDGGPVVLSAAPLVEGAVAAAARSRGGAELPEVASEARGALVMKTSQLEEEEPAEAPAALGVGANTEALVARLPVGNRLGLHLRPAGRIIELVAAHDATVELRNSTRGTGPADGRSVTGLAMLRAVQGDELEVATRGPQARDLVEALSALAAGNFGDRRTPRRRVEPAGPTAEVAPPQASSPGGGAARRVIPRVRGGELGRRAGSARVRPRRRFRRSAGEEARRLSDALDAARDQLAATAARLPAGEAEIFAAQTLLLTDAALIDPAHAAVAASKRRRARSSRRPTRSPPSSAGVDAPYLRARAIDVRDVADRVLAELVGVEARAPVEPGIVVADKLTPGRSRISTPPPYGGSPPPAAGRSTTPRSSPGHSGSR